MKGSGEALAGDGFGNIEPIVRLHDSKLSPSAGLCTLCNLQLELAAKSYSRA
ncbi:hypothetical protein Mapa_017634 [Marchantia paleacea]|nr:hypothetical protein Mapa_017634 [Marchantia paleacea]